MKISGLGVVCLLVALLGACRGQVTKTGVFHPSRLSDIDEDSLAVYEMPPQDNDKQIQLAQAEERQALLKPFKFGNAIPFELRADRDGDWSITEDGKARVWRAEIYSENASSLSLIFDSFYLPPKAELYVTGKQFTLGALTGEVNNKEDGAFSTAPIPGDTLLLEYFEPIEGEELAKGESINPASDSLRLKISSVVHGFRRPYSHGQSAGCNVDVACTLTGDKKWRDQVNSVAIIIMGQGESFCTGTVLNNTEEDGRQLFLTAYHCVSDDIFNSIVGFNFQYKQCEDRQNPRHNSCHGLKPLALWPDSDLALFEIKETIPDDYRVYYAGWDARNRAPEDVTCIHHPWGDVKKMARYHGSCQWSRYENSPGFHHWKVPYWNLGTTEPGSSGSALFNGEGLVVGHLHGGTASCDRKQGYDIFGALVSDWDASRRRDDRAKYYLNPSDKNTLKMYGSYYKSSKEGAHRKTPCAYPGSDQEDEEEGTERETSPLHQESNPVAISDGNVQQPELFILTPAVSS